MAKKDKNTRPEFIKLVYFDEISATDLVYFKFGGSLNEQNDVSKEQSNEMQVDGTVSGNIGSRFFSFFNVKAGVE